MRPQDVTFYNAHQVWNRMYGHLLKAKSKAPALNVGDEVLIAKELSPFHKQYQGDWSTEVFKIADVRRVRGGKARYLLIDGEDEPILGAFKETELQPISLNVRTIHKVMRSRKDSKGRIPVKWRGYKRLEEWLPVDDV